MEPGPDSKQPTEVWKTISQILPARDVDFNYWWRRAGPQAAIVLDKAGYSAEEQYKLLIWLYHWVIPELGPAMSSVDRKWRSLLQMDGSAFELSWKWNTANSEPAVRYVTEPIGSFTGTSLDPLNQRPSMELRHRLAAILPKVDLTWAHHFSSTLFGHDQLRLKNEMMPPGHKLPPGFTIPSNLVGLEIPSGKGDIFTKSYFIPRKHGQGFFLPVKEWESAIAELSPESRARQAVLDFVEKDFPGDFTPIMLAVDDIDPSVARIKWYFATGTSSMSWVRNIMTLGGRITTDHLPHLERQLEDLYTLIKGVTGMPENFDQDTNLLPAKRFDPAQGEGNYVQLPVSIAGYQMHFDIAPGSKSDVPGIKLYVPMRRYMRDDLSIARGIIKVMESRGQSQYCQAYLDMLEGILPSDKHVNEYNGAQTYVSCLFKKDGELEITSYLGLANLEGEHRTVAMASDAA